MKSLFHRQCMCSNNNNNSYVSIRHSRCHRRSSTIVKDVGVISSRAQHRIASKNICTLCISIVVQAHTHVYMERLQLDGGMSVIPAYLLLLVHVLSKLALAYIYIIYIVVHINTVCMAWSFLPSSNHIVAYTLGI